MFEFLRKLLGQNNDAEIKKLQKIVVKINGLEGDMQKLTDDSCKKLDELLAKKEKELMAV
mgnify:CR=1 FL=1